jgi:hypothetical protein
MTTELFFNFSRRIYAMLARLYPAEHRARYAASMNQLFTDQCREEVQKHGAWGLLGIWLRTLPDFLLTIIMEHGHAANLRTELIDPDPSRQLPWKAVALVLTPGLVVSLGQLLSFFGNSWYFEVHDRLGFYLVIPVLFVWIWTRKFPLWGLLPLGMVCNHIVGIFWYAHVVQLVQNWFPQNFDGILPILDLFRFEGLSGGSFVTMEWYTRRLISDGIYFFELVALVAAGLFLIRRWLTGTTITKTIKWIRVFLGIAIGLMLLFVIWQFQTFGKDSTIRDQILPSVEIYLAMVLSLVTEPVYLFFLVGLSALFAKRFGSWSVLLLLGYLLPTVLIGFGDSQQWKVTLTITMTVIILCWRIGIALVSPLLIIRSATTRMRRAALLVPLGLILAIRQTWSIAWGAVYGFPFSNVCDFVQLFPSYLSDWVIPFLFFALAIEIFSLRGKSLLGEAPASAIHQAVRQ